MQTHLQKWGNSLGVRIPSQLASELHLTVNSPIEISIEDEHLVIKRQQYSLAEFLKKINKNNLHHVLLDDDSVRGNEAW